MNNPRAAKKSVDGARGGEPLFPTLLIGVSG